jgi:hypothetical protein
VGRAKKNFRSGVNNWWMTSPFQTVVTVNLNTVMELKSGTQTIESGTEVGCGCRYLNGYSHETNLESEPG